MASIEIKADIVIKACEKALNRPIKRRWSLRAKAEQEWENIHVNRTKKLAEYAIKPERVNEEWLKSTSDTTVTITHNDFELIGEFL